MQAGYIVDAKLMDYCLTAHKDKARQINGALFTTLKKLFLKQFFRFGLKPHRIKDTRKAGKVCIDCLNKMLKQDSSACFYHLYHSSKT